MGRFITEVVTWVIPIFIMSVLLGFVKISGVGFLLLFILSAFGALTIGYFIELIVGILTFYTVSAWGLQCFKQAIMAFFSGRFNAN